MLRELGLATYENRLAIDADRVAQFISDRSRAGQITLPPIDDVLEAPEPSSLAPARAGGALGSQRSVVARTSEAASSP
jgi:hypothetical protein